MRRVWPILSAGERGLSIAAISLMSLLPCIAMVTRLAGTAGISGSVVFVQQLTLCVAFLGGRPRRFRRPPALHVREYVSA